MHVLQIAPLVADGAFVVLALIGSIPVTLEATQGGEEEVGGEGPPRSKYLCRLSYTNTL